MSKIIKLISQNYNQSYMYRIIYEPTFLQLCCLCSMEQYLADVARNDHLIFKVCGKGFILRHW